MDFWLSYCSICLNRRFFEKERYFNEVGSEKYKLVKSFKKRPGRLNNTYTSCQIEILYYTVFMWF